MKYCKKCNRMYNDSDEKCTECKKPLYEIEDENTPVYLLSATGFELDRVKAALEDNGIPCDSLRKKNATSADAVTGFDTSEYYIVVPYSAYEKAYDTCVGIGAIKDEEAEILDENVPYSEENIKSVDEQFEEMSGAKRTTVRIVSAILLIILFAGVIYGTDFIMQLIKGLFT
ncbi:MAG: hypothetical protein U0L76_03175 [Ruminococcus sp.]|nr:hypothetical protein [Ruminococcus sp.]